MAYQPYIKKSNTEIVELPLNASLLDGKSPSYYLNYNNFINAPTLISYFTNDVGYVDIGTTDLKYYYTKDEVDSIIGNINNILDSINGEVI